jgi:ribosomal protein L44E
LVSQNTSPSVAAVHKEPPLNLRGRGRRRGQADEGRSEQSRGTVGRTGPGKEGVMVRCFCTGCGKLIGWSETPDGRCIDCEEKETQEKIRQYNLKVVERIEDLMIQAIKTRAPQ